MDFKKEKVMNPEQYEKRVRHQRLPLDFQYQDAVEYKSNWEYIKDKLSNYHFDKWKIENEGEWWNKLGKFQLTEEILNAVSVLEEKSKKIGWFDVTSTYHPGFPNGKSPLLEQEHYDREKSGIQGEYTQVVPEEDIANTCLQDLGKYWKLNRLRTRVHVQFPGQMFAMHIDKLWHRFPNDPKKIIRLVVNLSDYEPGQLMIYGNSVFTQWTQGDIHCFDTLNVPHATANLSTKPRAILIITGVRTPETDKLLLNSKLDTIHTI